MKYKPVKFEMSMLASILKSYGFKVLGADDYFNMALIMNPLDQELLEKCNRDVEEAFYKTQKYYHNIGRTQDNNEFLKEVEPLFLQPKGRRVYKKMINKNPKKEIKWTNIESMFVEIDNVAIELLKKYPNSTIMVMINPDFPTYDTYVTGFVSSLN